MSELKIDNIKIANAANAPLNIEKTKTNEENTSKDMQKSTDVGTQESNAPTVKKHLITYIGNGEFVDVCGHKWHKDDEQTYSEEEYKVRCDIHFMVKYGAMKHSVVTI